MEIENKRNYLALWLCISILLHLLLTMLGVVTIKTLEKKDKKEIDLDNILNKKNLTEQPESAKISKRVAHSLIFMNPSQQKTKEKKSMNDDEHPSKIKKSSIKPLKGIDSSLKVQSKKHRPAEKITDEQKSCELSESPKSKKKKFSLADLKKGFSRFIQQGNDLASIQGNSEETNAEGLKKLSYLRQVGHMYMNVEKKYITHIPNNNLIMQDSIVKAVVERSGKVISYALHQSSGDPIIDQYHIDMVKSLGMLPRIPKYLEAPQRIFFLMTWKQNKQHQALQVEDLPKLQL